MPCHVSLLFTVAVALLARLATLAPDLAVPHVTQGNGGAIEGTASEVKAAWGGENSEDRAAIQVYCCVCVDRLTSMPPVFCSP
jgi:hypothetical protein